MFTWSVTAIIRYLQRFYFSSLRTRSRMVSAKSAGRWRFHAAHNLCWWATPWIHLPNKGAKDLRVQARSWACSWSRGTQVQCQDYHYSHCWDSGAHTAAQSSLSSSEAPSDPTPNLCSVQQPFHDHVTKRSRSSVPKNAKKISFLISIPINTCRTSI